MAGWGLDGLVGGNDSAEGDVPVGVVERFGGRGALCIDRLHVTARDQHDT